jgi:hypothetical protein
MIHRTEDTGHSAPYTYQQWLDCFMLMKQQPLSSAEPYEAAASGSFSGTPAMQAALQQQMVDTINVVLNRSIKRFVRELNECITFNELDRAEFLFKRLKKDIHKTLFFMQLSFLSADFKTELYSSISVQMNGFWDDTIGFLRKQAVEYENSDLEDAIYLVRRIKLFS